MAADGSIVIDTRIDTAGFGKGAANLKSQFAALGTSVKKLGGLIATAFSVTAIVNFAKEAIELGSDLQEVQNVVDVTFTTLNEQVNEFAKNAATTAGLSETMAKQYVGTFGAMAKSFQFTEEEAMNMSTTLTQLAGDVASFYNLTQDTAYTKLKSVFTGETESLKDLGVVMTQTALDDYALRKGLGKTTSEMTEQEKVALRYQFVLEQLSAASGDFIRTQDGWANQTRILSLQFDQLKATLGQGLINALTPAIKVLNQLIAKLQTAAEAFRDFTAALFGNAGDASSSIESVTESTEEYGDAIEEAAKQAKKALAPFDEITKLSSESSNTETASSILISTTVSGGSETITAETIAPGLQNAVDTIIEWIEPLKNIDFSNISTSFDQLEEAVEPLTEDLFSGLEWAWENILVPLSEWFIEDAASSSVASLASAFNTLDAILQPLGEGIETLWDDIKPVFGWIGETAVGEVDQLEEAFNNVASTFEEKGPQIQKIFSGIGEIISVVWFLLKPVLEEMKRQFGVTFEFIGAIASSVIGTAIDGLSELIEFVSGVFTGDWERAWKASVSPVKEMVNAIIEVLNSFIRAVVSGINTVISAFNAISFELPDWGILGDMAGKKFGLKIKTITAPQIPYLAQGAVIPPNAPFVAMLGDQRHGTNIEAPLETIQEAVAVVMEDMLQSNMAGHEATVSVLRDILEAVLGIHIGDDVIGRAAERYNSDMEIIRGGNI